MMRCTVVLGLLALVTAGCAERSAEEVSQPAGVPPTQAAIPAGTISGTVREQIPVSPYVYVRLETSNGDVWAAVIETPLTDGDDITVHNVMRMAQFASPTLNRTFDEIYFGSLQPVDQIGESAAAPLNPDVPTSTVGAPPAVMASVGLVQRAAGPHAQTIGALWSQKEQLAGTAVSVRGVIVKVNDGVMGKNWLHLQDGSGNTATGTHDLTVTTLGTATIGDTVTVTGVVRLNRDFGLGYTYPLIVEDAQLVRR